MAALTLHCSNCATHGVTEHHMHSELIRSGVKGFIAINTFCIYFFPLVWSIKLLHDSALDFHSFIGSLPYKFVLFLLFRWDMHVGSNAKSDNVPDWRN